jgi:nicotinate phosphoribosyltransferase
MAVFNKPRMTNRILQIDVEGLRQGRYSDKYFANAQHILTSLRAEGYHFSGQSPRNLSFDPAQVQVGDMEVEAQVFNRRQPYALIAGIDVALSMIRHASGHYGGQAFIEAWSELKVIAVQDGDITHYEGDLSRLQPVLEIRGRYSEFALLETPILGVLTRASRIATNVYDVLQAANGKDVLFFPARFDLSETQSLDGYAYWLAVQRFNHQFGHNIRPLVSTDAQAKWWGGKGGGTVPHSVIACFFADTAEMMRAFAHHIPLDVPRIALVDFNNDTVRTSLAMLNAFWPKYLAALTAGDGNEQRRWTLHGVRLDTAANMRDAALQETDPTGVSPLLVRAVRRAIDNAWASWDVPVALEPVAKEYCKNVQIVVSGGFNRLKIESFEREDTPVDAYGVGSTLLTNDKSTATDFTMDVVRLNIDGKWINMCKTGRYPCDNIDLHPVDLSTL